MSHISLRAAVMAAVPLFVSIEAAGVDLTPVSQTREIEGDARIQLPEGPITDTQSDAASDFGPFNSSVTATAQFPAQPQTFAQGSAAQNSQINPSSLVGNGSASAHANPFPFATTDSGSCLFSVTFSIAQPTAYLLTGQLQTSPPTIGSGPVSARAELSGSGGDLYLVEIDMGSAPLLSTGPLSPGTYTLDISAGAEIDDAGAAASAGFDFNFSLVPEPASAGCFAIVAWLAWRRRA